MAAEPEKTEPTLASLQQQLTALEKKFADSQKISEQWEVLSKTDKADQVLTAHAALLEDSNSWAQHYSTVRMTVTTFLVTVALAIVQFQWEKPTWAGVIGASVCWFVAVVLFIVFTKLEFRKLNETMRNKVLFRSLAGHKNAEKKPINPSDTASLRKLSAWSDVPSWTLFLLTGLFVLVVACQWAPRVNGTDADCDHACCASGCE